MAREACTGTRGRESNRDAANGSSWRGNDLGTRRRVHVIGVRLAGHDGDRHDPGASTMRCLVAGTRQVPADGDTWTTRQYVPLQARQRGLRTRVRRGEERGRAGEATRGTKRAPERAPCTRACRVTAFHPGPLDSCLSPTIAVCWQYHTRSRTVYHSCYPLFH